MKPIGRINNSRRETTYKKTSRKQTLNSPTNSQKTKSVLHSKQSNKGWRGFFDLFLPKSLSEFGERMAETDKDSKEAMSTLEKPQVEISSLEQLRLIEMPNKELTRQGFFNIYQALPLMKHLDQLIKEGYPIGKYEDLLKRGNPFNIYQQRDLLKFIDSDACIQLINTLLDAEIDYSALMVYAIRSSRKNPEEELKDKVAAVREKYGI